jgi:hypothetical protein
MMALNYFDGIETIVVIFNTGKFNSKIQEGGQQEVGCVLKE